MATRAPGEVTEEMLKLYKSGSSITSISQVTKKSVPFVRRTLRSKLGRKYRSPPAGRMPIPKGEIERRKQVALASSSWGDYEKRLGFGRRLPKNDRRFGIYLGCKVCPVGRKRPGIVVIGPSVYCKQHAAAVRGS